MTADSFQELWRTCWPLRLTTAVVFTAVHSSSLLLLRRNAFLCPGSPGMGAV
jgi:hypothetical protein